MKFPPFDNPPPGHVIHITPTDRRRRSLGPREGDPCESASTSSTSTSPGTRLDRPDAGGDGPGGRGRRGVDVHLDGPLVPDGADGHRPTTRCWRATRPSGFLAGQTQTHASRPAGHRGHLPPPRSAGQDRHHPRRALRRPGPARHRRRLVRARAPRPRRPVPAAGRAVRAARGDPADLPADVERRRRPVPRPPLPARRDHLLTAARSARPTRRSSSAAAASARRCAWSPATPTRATCSPPTPTRSPTSSTCSPATATPRAATPPRSSAPSCPWATRSTIPTVRRRDGRLRPARRHHVELMPTGDPVAYVERVGEDIVPALAELDPPRMNETSPTSTRSARQRILDTAHDLFYKHGFHAVGVDLVIERAQVAKTTLYRHFGSKDDLIVAYLTHVNEQFWAWFEASIDPAAPARDQLVTLFDAVQKLATVRPAWAVPFRSPPPSSPSTTTPATRPPSPTNRPCGAVARPGRRRRRHQPGRARRRAPARDGRRLRGGPHAPAIQPRQHRRRHRTGADRRPHSGPPTSTEGAQNMTAIAVLGAGNIGATLARKWATTGHQVALGSRTPDVPTLRDRRPQHRRPNREPHSAFTDAEVAVASPCPRSRPRGGRRPRSSARRQARHRRVQQPRRRSDEQHRRSHPARAQGDPGPGIQLDRLGELCQPRLRRHSSRPVVVWPRWRRRRPCRNPHHRHRPHPVRVGGLDQLPVVDMLASLWFALALGQTTGRHLPSRSSPADQMYRRRRAQRPCKTCPPTARSR